MSCDKIEKSCKNCAWYRGYTSIGCGCCHRHAPSPRMTEIDPIYWPSVDHGPFAQFPVLGEDDFCGEFEAKEAK